MIFMDADEELDIDGIDIDGDDYDEPDIEGTEVDEFKRDSVVVQHTQAAVRERVLKRYAGQLNAIDMAKAVKDELTPLMGSAERGALLEAAVVKLSIDILAENVKAKSVREAAQAIEVLARLQGMSADTGGPMAPGARMEVFERVREVLVRTTGNPDALPPTTREAIEVTASED